MNKRVKVLLTAMAMMVFLMISMTAYGADYTAYSSTKTGKVTLNNLAVRNDASTKADKLGSLEKDRKITLKGYTKVSDTTWYRIAYDGKAAFVSGKYVDIVDTTSYTIYTPYVSGTVTGNPINVRAKASSDAKKKGYIAKDTVIELQGYKYDSKKNLWYKITYDGSTAYVSGDFVRKQVKSSEEMTALVTYETHKTGITNKAVTIRDAASTSGKILGTIMPDTKVTLKGYRFTEAGGMWYRMTYDGKAAYIPASGINLTDKVPYTIYAPHRTYKTTRILNARKTADSKAESLGKIPKDTNITVLGGRTDAEGQLWFRIIYSGKAAYVMAKYTDRISDLDYDILTPFKTGRATTRLAARKTADVNGVIAGYIVEDTTMTIRGTITDADGRKWYRILYDGKTAYIKEAFTEIVTTKNYTIYTPWKTAKIKATAAARKTASTSAERWGTLKPDTKVTLKGYYYDADGTKWYRITYNGNAAYILADKAELVTTLSYTLITPSKLGTTTAGVNIRANASSSADKRGSWAKGTLIAIQGYKYDEENRKWYKSTYNGKVSYVLSDYVKLTTAEEAGYKLKFAKITSTNLTVRNGAGTEYSNIGTLYKGSCSEILSSKTGSDGNKWWKIRFGGGVGYICSVYTKTVTKTAEDAAEFESAIASAGFPDSYKPYLRTLHILHPKWVFHVQKTGLDWSDVVAAESKVGESLIQNSSAPAAWKSMEKGAYNFNTGNYITFDSGGWVTASKDVVKYYLDPRNFINDGYIFMFLDHKYDEATQSKDNVAKVVDGTFLDCKMPGTSSSYAYYIHKAGSAAGMNPNVLASMIIQEQGSASSTLISGTNSSYPGYYNYLNIGAYASGGMSAATRGLWWAAGAGCGATSYNRPWNTRYRALKGGAMFYVENYVKAKQNTLYLKKWNVCNGSRNLGLHQYMTNVQGAAGEASHLRSGYSALDDSPVSFAIPVYDSMPSGACALPGTKGNNNNFLSALSVKSSSKTYSLSPSFSKYEMSYEVTVPNSVKSVTVDATKISSSATMTGAGESISLSVGENVHKVKVTATSGQVRTYKITITRKSS